MTDEANEFEERARARKAAACADAWWDLCARSRVPADLRADRARRFGDLEANRRAVGQIAGTRTPSTKTWAQVIGLVEHRARYEAQRRTRRAERATEVSA